MYSVCGIAFDGVGSWNSDNDDATDVIIFGVNSSSSYHTDSRKDNLLVLGAGLAYVIYYYGDLIKRRHNFD